MDQSFVGVARDPLARHPWELPRPNHPLIRLPYVARVVSALRFVTRVGASINHN